MTPHLHQRFPGVSDSLAHVQLGTGPTPVRRLDALGLTNEVWLKDESGFGDGGWGGNKVRKLEWIIPEAHRRKQKTLFTVGGIGTHWGLAAALYGREHGIRTVLALIDQPVEIAAQVAAGDLPEPATIVTAVGSGGTAAGLALGLRFAGLKTRVFGVVVNDSLTLDAPTIAGLANRTEQLLRERGAVFDLVRIQPEDVTMRDDWLGETYGATTPEGIDAEQ